MFPIISALLAFTAGLFRSRDHSCLVRDPSRGSLIALLWVVTLVAGCGSFHPTPMSEVSFTNARSPRTRGRYGSPWRCPRPGRARGCSGCRWRPRASNRYGCGSRTTTPCRTGFYP